MLLYYWYSLDSNIDSSTALQSESHYFFVFFFLDDINKSSIIRTFHNILGHVTAIASSCPFFQWHSIRANSVRQLIALRWLSCTFPTCFLGTCK